MKTKQLVRFALTGVIVGAAALGACGTNESTTAELGSLSRARAVSGAYRLPDGALGSHVLAIAQARHEYTAAVNFERTLAESLPNQVITVNGEVVKGTRGVVIGKIVDVAPGAAYTVAGDDADSGTQVRFDHPDAVWRIAVVTVDAGHYLTGGSGGDRERSTVKFGAFISADEDAQMQMRGIESLGDVIVVLDPVRTYGFQKGLPWVARSGALLGDIDANGTIGFPALGTENKEFVGSLTTVDKVLAQADRHPGPLAVTVDPSNGKVTWLPALPR